MSEVSNELSKRLISIFEKDSKGQRPVHDKTELYKTDTNFKDIILFYEYFNGDTSRGLGASQQTGWTGVVAELINRVSTFEKKQVSKSEEVFI